MHFLKVYVQAGDYTQTHPSRVVTVKIETITNLQKLIRILLLSPPSYILLLKVPPLSRISSVYFCLMYFMEMKSYRMSFLIYPLSVSTLHSVYINQSNKYVCEWFTLFQSCVVFCDYIPADLSVLLRYVVFSLLSRSHY